MTAGANSSSAPGTPDPDAMLGHAAAGDVSQGLGFRV